MSQNLIGNQHGKTQSAAGDVDAAHDELTKLAGRANALTQEARALQTRFAASVDDEVSRMAFSIGDSNGWLSLFADEIHNAAEKLGRVREARADDACGLPWGVCPEHGNTLSSSGGQTWCRNNSCIRVWDFDRSGSPCAEPVAFRVTDANGEQRRWCAGHALDAQERLIGCTVQPLQEPPRMWSTTPSIVVTENSGR